MEQCRLIPVYPCWPSIAKIKPWVSGDSRKPSIFFVFQFLGGTFVQRSSGYQQSHHSTTESLHIKEQIHYFLLQEGLRAWISFPLPRFCTCPSQWLEDLPVKSVEDLQGEFESSLEKLAMQLLFIPPQHGDSYSSFLILQSQDFGGGITSLWWSSLKIIPEKHAVRGRYYHCFSGLKKHHLQHSITSSSVMLYYCYWFLKYMTANWKRRPALCETVQT